MHPIGININVNFLACLVLFLAARPRLKALLVMSAAGAALGACLGLHGGILHAALEALSYCGAGALPAVWLTPLIGGPSNLKLLGKLLVPPAFGYLSALLLGLGAVGITYDHLLYAFDGSLGFQPSFWAGQAVSVAPWVSRLTRGLYDGLPLFVVAAYVLEERRDARRARDLFFLVMLIGICGSLCFVLFPAVGAYFLYAGSFPWRAPALSSVSLVPTLVTAAVPRNCMPSLHTAWALAVFWAARRFHPGWRLLLRGLLMLMLLQTLVFHYLADMVVALPFTLALYALTYSDVPWPARQRRYACYSGVLLVAAWLAALRWGAGFFLLSPAIPWLAALFTVAACHFLRRSLEKAADARMENAMPAPGRLEPELRLGVSPNAA